ncbi:MAG: glycoside hydrolase family 5 protein [Halanaerobiaceae bacterium]
MNNYGFNFLWMFSRNNKEKPEKVNKKELDMLKEMGFNYVRIPTDYRFWIHDHEYFYPDESILEYIDSYLEACKKRELHMCLNIHRAPGYCINRNDLEIHNLWEDEIAQEAFAFQWETFAERYKDVSNKYLSFDLVNEPAQIGEYGMTRDKHEKVIRKTFNAIKSIDSERVIQIDGLGGGNIPMPELADLDVIQCARGYQPMALSHYKADWWDGYKGLSEPEYPGLEWNNKVWNKETIRKFYQPWLELEKKGVKVFIGEFGCFNKTPNDVALCWFEDLLSLFKEFGWGYSLWNFKGPFGIFNHGRPETEYEKWEEGYKLDRKLLDLLKKYRIKD